ncbi:Pollen receptor-like kinase 3 [Datura stramonium]|uniref:Pollen receptor-like kinase 3 n=1 Tax=Datura stramonium TaxID=4076 RepID=A0ABS8RXA8_DATST|nr:Pollen receptor-like kinase 3 [Datura stramonium]
MPRSKTTKSNQENHHTPSKKRNRETSADCLFKGKVTCLATNMATIPLILLLLLQTSSSTPKRHHLFLFHITIFFLIFLSNPHLSLSISEDEALIKFKESLKNTTVLDSSWHKGTSPCDKNKNWACIRCEGNTVEALLLGESGLSGELDIDPLIALPGLRVFDLANNSFAGTIPEFFLLGALKSLFIDGNQFSGEIPKDFFSKMGSLKKIWLSRNKFSGPIPESLANLKYLMELRLESNAFSGYIPSLSQGSLTSIDLSNNKLQGEIPQSMSKFGADSFKGNNELCGQQLGKECNKETKKDEGAPMPDLKWIILAIVACLLLVAILFRAKRKEDHFDKLGKENLDEGLHVPSSNRRTTSIQSKGGGDSVRGSSRRGGSQSGKPMGDLVLVNNEKGPFGLPDLMKAAAEVLGNGVLGSAYKAKMVNGLSVVVKRLREMNKMNRDVFDAEIRKLGNLRHRNILQLLAYHYRKEEKLLVSEYVPKGSLLYLLHGDRGISHAKLNWPTRLRIIHGVASGMYYLHCEFASYPVPHGNLKSSNILLNEKYEPLLSDYAFYPLINNTQIVQSLFAYKAPEAIQNQQLTPKCDVYCLGIIIVETLTGKFPSQYLNNQKGGTDVVQWVQSAIADKRESELIDPEIASATDSIEQMVKLLHVGAACTVSDPDKRIDMKETLRRIEEISSI